MDFLTSPWLFRYGHVLGAGLWVGGYALLALIIIPLLAKEPNNTLRQVAITSVQVLTYSGVATIFFGILLIMRTRGFAAIIQGGEWGGIIIICIIMAIALLGMGDSALRPALQRLAETGDSRPARRLAWIGFILIILTIGFMTRALYATS